MEKYYKILGVDVNSNKSEIKKAYRSLSKKYHPDVNPDDPDTENKFKEITEAYEILIGKQKPKETQHRNRAFKAKPIRIFLNLTLEEVFNGVKKRVDYQINDICNTCNGEGGFEPQTCNHCGGLGYRKKGPFAIVCEYCGGVGKTFKKPCYTCSNSGYVRSKTHIDLDIPQGVTEHTIMSYPGVGDYIKDGYRGDVHFVTKIEPHPVYELDGLHLKRTLEVPIVDILLGVDKEIDTLSGKIKIKIPKLTNLTRTFRLRGKGLQDNSMGLVGDLYIKLSPITPKELTSEEELLLLELKKQPNFID